MLTIARHPDALAITATEVTDRGAIERAAVPELRGGGRVHVFSQAEGCRNLVCTFVPADRAVFVGRPTGNSTKRGTITAALAVGLDGLADALQDRR